MHYFPGLWHLEPKKSLAKPSVKEIIGHNVVIDAPFWNQIWKREEEKFLLMDKIILATFLAK